MAETKKNYEEDPRYSNWNYFYVSLFKEIDIVTNIIFQTRANLMDKKKTADNLEIFHSKIMAISLSYGSYIQEQEDNVKRLTKIYDLLKSAKYLTSLTNKNDVKEYQYKILRQLETIWENINISFSNKGLSPKIIKTNQRDPSKAILEGYH